MVHAAAARLQPDLRGFALPDGQREAVHRLPRAGAHRRPPAPAVERTAGDLHAEREHLAEVRPDVYDDVDDRAGADRVPLRGGGMTRILRTIACGLLLVALAGCSRSATGAVPTTATAARSDVPALATPSAAPTVSPVATPTASLAPEAFWTLLFSGEPTAIDYPTLAGMASDCDLVVLGTFKAVRPGPDSDAGGGFTNYMLTVDVTVERVLLGKMPTTATTIPVAVFLGVGTGASPYLDMIAQRAASLPQERGVLFLQNLVKYYSRYDASAPQRYDPSVYQVASLQGIVRDNAGVSWLPAQAPGTWTSTLRDKPFSSALQTVATAAASAAGAGQ